VAQHFSWLQVHQRFSWVYISDLNIILSSL